MEGAAVGRGALVSDGADGGAGRAVGDADGSSTVRAVPGALIDPPPPDKEAGRDALRALLRERSLLPALAAVHRRMGDVFRLPLPAFSPVVLVGPAAARFVLLGPEGDLLWRFPKDPVARLLRHGVLVEDGAAHDALRALMAPALHKRIIDANVDAMVGCVDRVLDGWPAEGGVDALPEMRRIALAVLTETLFGVDIHPDLARLWRSILGTLRYISPGLWIVWPDAPRPGYGRALRTMDAYLMRLIALRRAMGDASRTPGGADAGVVDGPADDDLLGLLVRSDLSDQLIRDQLLTMLIAGHDTATALLAWAIVALAQHPDVQSRARAEVVAVLGDAPPTAETAGRLPYLEQVIKETLRLYPPIHVGNRRAARDLEFEGHRIAKGTRVLFSIFLTQRHPAHWPDPERFDPERFDMALRSAPDPFTYLPFGGGPRFCIGTAMARIEARVVLARLLQRYEWSMAPGARVTLRMGATLEPGGRGRVVVVRGVGEPRG
ncbi:MAG: cytochrome P450 [Ardenticatenales bacterium]